MLLKASSTARVTERQSAAENPRTSHSCAIMLRTTASREGSLRKSTFNMSTGWDNINPLYRASMWDTGRYSLLSWPRSRCIVLLLGLLRGSHCKLYFFRPGAPDKGVNRCIKADLKREDWLFSGQAVSLLYLEQKTVPQRTLHGEIPRRELPGLLQSGRSKRDFATNQPGRPCLQELWGLVIENRLQHSYHLRSGLYLIPRDPLLD
jgi:hypothetical protein